ncbi:hypothetical protein CG478_013650 [Bacillus cytotoxicus]|nr:hypothetical protein CG483_013650 [Bacillus cytotoxicus]AWC41391.1 hypothetical protein CG480_013650 [Bacillus cytotoxicus]AWC49322.1 hypothetical protein CG478_013650 [Bacillus cytotoxicus]AWC53337.1 hypothetical protein CG477_013610 [Bacillus cytotoxicus]AWC57464.1 hypothetical protein CG476_013635 [Bacillus cytotoxicus]
MNRMSNSSNYLIIVMSLFYSIYLRDIIQEGALKTTLDILLILVLIFCIVDTVLRLYRFFKNRRGE